MQTKIRLLFALVLGTMGGLSSTCWAGASLVKDINTRYGDSWPQEFTLFNDRVYFRANAIGTARSFGRRRSRRPLAPFWSKTSSQVAAAAFPRI